MLGQANKIAGAGSSADNGRLMDVTLAIVADAANISQEGKLNVLGAFSNINAKGFPARHPSMVLVVEMDASISDAGGVKALVIKVLDPDGQELGEITGEITIPAPPGPGQRIHFGFVIPMIDVTFLRDGNHMLDVIVGGESRKHVPLSITLIPEVQGQ